MSRAKSIGYKPLQDPKYVLGDLDDEDAAEDEELE